MMTHLNSNKIYYVYKILFEGKTVYIGRTNNITKRKQHHKSLYKSGKKKKLYDYLRNTNKFDGIFELITIKSFINLTDAKNYEMLLILKDYFGKKELLQSVPKISDFHS